MSKSIVEHCKDRDQFCHLEDGYLNWFPCRGKGGLTAENLREIANYLEEQNADHHAQITKFFLDSKIKDGGYTVYIHGKLVDCVPTAKEAVERASNRQIWQTFEIGHTDPSVDCSEFTPF